MKKTLFVFLVAALFLVAARPLQEAQPTFEWRDVFKLAIMLVTALVGAPVTQALKNALGAQGRWALVLTAVIAVALAVLELILSNTIGLGNLTVENLPGTVFLIFGVASAYYAWFKESPSFFGKGFLLKDKKNPSDPLQ